MNPQKVNEIAESAAPRGLDPITLAYIYVSAHIAV